MKIVSAKMIDPRATRNFAEPRLVLLVDEPVMELGDPVQFDHSSWRIVPCGPFFAVEFSPELGVWTDEVDLGRFNVLGYRRHQLAAVTVDTPEDRLELQMPVPRVRRLLNRHTPEWRIRVDQEAALDGKLHWLYERAEPECFGRTERPHFEKDRCTRKPEDIILFKSTHLPLCEVHHMSHKRHIERLRINQLRAQRPTG